MAVAAGFLAWKAARAEILFADGLRYIAQAQRIDRGALVEGLFRSVDHPAYPLAIAGAHRALGGEGPESWQRAAQAAAILSGILLIVPLYLVAAELFGGASAWLAVLLSLGVPLVGDVLADTMSEGTFLLFWTWGLWAALRFLKRGGFGWLPPAIGFGALAYLSRPEGLLLPAALVATLALMPLLRSTRLNWPRWWAAVGLLIIGPAVLVGPYVAVKGGLGTKPAIARLLGTAPRSAAGAVERQRPLDPDESPVKTYAVAAKAVFGAVRDAVTLPLLVLAALGLAWRPAADRARLWLFVGVIGIATLLALVRLHATGGYCSARHALVPALILIPAAAFGLHRLIGSIAIPGRWLGLGEGRWTAGPAVWALILGGLVAGNWPRIREPIGSEFVGYRQAARFVAEHVPAGSKVVDLTGWTQFYSDRPGYTFADAPQALGDPEVRWVVARENHLLGPWEYCGWLRVLTGHLTPVATFPESLRPDQAKVYVFQRPPGHQSTAMIWPDIRHR
jgi:4-amino-4-deoxy-L-arabinose transferase-like glycosyltransferase